MDLENLVYVALAVIYFLSRVFKKRKQAPTESPEESSQPQPGKRPVSFEDLLKEFGVDKGVEEQKEEKDEVDDFQEEKETDEYRSRYEDEEAQSVYEKSIKEVELTSEKEEAESNKGLVFKEFKPYQEEDDSNEFASEIRELLQSEDGGKKAIVLGEILNRKY